MRASPSYARCIVATICPPYHRANFVNLLEKKWRGVVKLNCSGILEVFTDIFELISSRIGLFCNFQGDL